jgi:hypothetical protein
MHPTHRRGPSSRWRPFLRQHASTVWACDFFCVQTITFQTLYEFFVIHERPDQRQLDQLRSDSLNNAIHQRFGGNAVY